MSRHDATRAFHSGNLADLHDTTISRLEIERRNAPFAPDPIDAALARQDEILCAKGATKQR